MSKSVPDNVVYNARERSYDASLKPYPTNLGAPVITVPDTLAWKNSSALAVNRKLETAFRKIKEEYQVLMEEYEYNRLVLSSQFSFEPVIGQTYHLYRRENGETFLSIIDPEICDFDAVGSFYLDQDRIWQKVG